MARCRRFERARRRRTSRERAPRPSGYAPNLRRTGTGCFATCGYRDIDMTCSCSADQPRRIVRPLTKVFRALGDETRVRMVALLSRCGELCVCHLEKAARSQPAELLLLPAPAFSRTAAASSIAVATARAESTTGSPDRKQYVGDRKRARACSLTTFRLERSLARRPRPREEELRAERLQMMPLEMIEVAPSVSGGRYRHRFLRTMQSMILRTHSATIA